MQGIHLDVLSGPFQSLRFVCSLAQTSSTLGLVCISHSLCDLAKSLALSGSHFPHLYHRGVCWLWAFRSLCALWTTRVVTGLPAGWHCAMRGHKPSSLMWTPSLCASSGHQQEGAEAASPPRWGDDRDRPYFSSKVGIRESCKVRHHSGKC